MLKFILALTLSFSLQIFSCEDCIDDIKEKKQKIINFLSNHEHVEDTFSLNIEEIFFLKGVNKGIEECLQTIHENHPSYK